MGRVKNNQNVTSRERTTNQSFMNNQASQKILEHAEVIDIILDLSHPSFNPEEGLVIGCVKARTLGRFNMVEQNLEWYHPYLANFFSGEGFNNPSWLEEAYKHQDPTKLTEEQQETVFLSDFLQRKGTTKMLKNYTKNPSIETFQPLYNAWHTKGSGPNMRKYILDKLPEFKKKLGGMIEKDPYKRQPKFI